MVHRGDTEDAEGDSKKNLCVLCGHEKKFKNHQNCNFGLNEIKYLQLLIFAKRDFSHDLCLCGDGSTGFRTVSPRAGRSDGMPLRADSPERRKKAVSGTTLLL
jgi:hypothetical protein